MAVRRHDAAGIEIPTPVNITTYAATHAGHFGRIARIVPGTIQLTAPSTRRVMLD